MTPEPSTDQPRDRPWVARSGYLTPYRERGLCGYPLGGLNPGICAEPMDHDAPGARSPHVSDGSRMATRVDAGTPNPDLGVVASLKSVISAQTREINLLRAQRKAAFDALGAMLVSKYRGDADWLLVNLRGVRAALGETE